MANVIFAVRGDSMTARYAPGGATPGNLGGVTQVNAAGTGIIGAGYIEMSTSLASRGLYWPALGNFPTTCKFSFLARVAIFGNTTSANCICGLGQANQAGTAGLILQSSTLYQYAESLTTAQVSVSNNSSAWTPTLGIYYDVVGIYDLTSTAAHSLILYVDGVALNDNNNVGTWTAPRQTQGWSICLGMNNYGTTTRMRVNEFVIWDGVIDPTSGGLNLNGSSRNSFITASVFDGSLPTVTKSHLGPFRIG